MAYLQARSGIARAGVTYAGLCASSFVLTVNGATRPLLARGFSVTETLTNDAGRLTFEADADLYTPTVGQAVTFLLATPNWYQFAGTIVRCEIDGDKSKVQRWRCEAVDNTWLMDRHSKVTYTYYDTGFSTIIGHILANYTDGGFSVGYCPMTLGTLARIDFYNESVSGAFNRLASAAEAQWFVDAERRVYFFDTLPDGNAPTISNSSKYRNVVYGRDLSQVRTQILVFAGGSRTTEPVPTGASAIPVEETRWYQSDELLGTILVGTHSYDYVVGSVSTMSGPGSINLSGGTVEEDIPQGTLVRVQVFYQDLTAIANLAATLGGGLLGFATHVIDNPELTYAEALIVAEADIENFGSALTTLDAETSPTAGLERFLQAGQLLTVNITDPITASATLRVQRVTTDMHDGLTASVSRPRLRKRLTAGTLYRPPALATRKE